MIEIGAAKPLQGGFPVMETGINNCETIGGHVLVPCACMQASEQLPSGAGISGIGIGGGQRGLIVGIPIRELFRLAKLGDRLPMQSLGLEDDAAAEMSSRESRIEFNRFLQDLNRRVRRQLGLFEAEIRSILAGQRPRLVHVLYFDAAVQKVETYQAGQPVCLSPVGGGGTDFRPCFDWLEGQGIVPQTLVFLADLCGTFPSAAPPYPGVLFFNRCSKSVVRRGGYDGGRVTLR